MPRAAPSSSRNRRKTRSRKRTAAQQADKYDLYQKSVQNAWQEVRMMTRAYKRAFRRDPLLLREDFCGTAAVCAEWVKSKPARHAIGVDLDPEPLSWGEANNFSKLTEEQISRIQLIEGDVRDRGEQRVDVVAAQNFSYFCFKDRETLGGYFRTAFDNLADEGVLFLDMLGGSDCQVDEREEERGIENEDGDDFLYVWEQAVFQPFTFDFLAHIHFRFTDGSSLEKAFTYDWRLWSLPEIRELLVDAGFADLHVYWEDTDAETGEGTGTYRLRKRGEADPSWLAYLVAIKR